MKHNAKHCKTNAFTGGTWQCHFFSCCVNPKQVIHTGKELFPQSSCNDSSDHKPLKTKKHC